MFRGSKKEDGLTSWLKFFNLTNNKNTLDYADTVKAIVLINFTMEEFIIKKEELEDLFERAIITEDVIDNPESYIGKNIVYMPAGLNIHFYNKKGSEYNQYIFNVCYSIAMENINIYFNNTGKILSSKKMENIRKAKLSSDRYSLVIDRIMKILYLFEKYNSLDNNLDKIYRYLSYSIRTEGIMLKSIIKEILELLLEKSYIDIDLEGNYFIISEERKEIRKKTIEMIKNSDNMEADKLLRAIVKDSFKDILEETGELTISIDILGDKINKTNNNINLKLDFHIGEEKDSKRSYYLLNTRQFANTAYWCITENLNFYNKIKWFLAYNKAIDFYIDQWEKSEERMEELKLEHENRMLILKEIKEEILNSFSNGVLIYAGEENKLDGGKEVKEVLKEIAETLETKNRFRKILGH